MSCENCKFSTPRPRRKLIREEWEDDPRPIRKGWKATWWNPRDYKDANPYDYDGFLEYLDEARERDNNSLIYCDRYPEREVTLKVYQCGEYKTKG